MKKICVYTCITGSYDDLKEIKNIEKNIDYYCFTNNKNIKSNTWNIVYIDDKTLTNIELARKIKILGHEKINNNYDIQVWMDAAVEFQKNINDFIKEYLKKDDVFVCFKHECRKSILQEMDSCLRFRKETIEKIDKLKQFYLAEKYNYDNGLIESTVFIKRANDKKVIETMDLWFNILKKYTTRDQLSFNYCIYKTKLKVKWINEKVFDNAWFNWYEHGKSLIPSEYLIYYGDININYNYKLQHTGRYLIKDNVYTINEKIINDTDRIYLELSNYSFIKYDIKKINKSNVTVFNHNTITLNNVKFFYKKPGFIEIFGDFKKGDSLMISIYFDIIKNYEKDKIIDKIISEKVEFIEKNKKLKLDESDIKNRYKILEESYNSILNSLSWKITKPIRMIMSKFRK